MSLMAAVKKTALWSVIAVQTSEFGADQRRETRERYDATVAGMI